MMNYKECSALRGLAIIGIFLHNYCHWLNPIVKENEYTFTQHNVDWLAQVLAYPDWNLPVHLLSFFGHYGVPVFFFLSAFGLVMKYEKNEERRMKNEESRGNEELRMKNEESRGNEELRIKNEELGLRHDATTAKAHSSFFILHSSLMSSLMSSLKSSLIFIRYHYLKLFKMMILGFVAFTMIDAITPGGHSYKLMDVISQLLMFNNVMPDPDHIIWPGPYWFFGVMLQLYIVYRLFLYRRGWKWVVGMIVVCWLMQIFCDPEGDTLNRIRYNFMGGMLPFGAGLLYARHGRDLSRPVYTTIMLVSAVLVFTFSYNYQLWFWVPLFVCSFSVGLVKILPASMLPSLEWMGSISAALFVCHPITRKIFIPISRNGDIYTGLLLYIIASIAIAWLFREILRKMPNPVMKKDER